MASIRERLLSRKPVVPMPLPTAMPTGVAAANQSRPPDAQSGAMRA
jgi:hypothetical protein